LAPRCYTLRGAHRRGPDGDHRDCRSAPLADAGGRALRSAFDAKGKGDQCRRDAASRAPDCPATPRRSWWRARVVAKWDAHLDGSAVPYLAALTG